MSERNSGNSTADEVDSNDNVEILPITPNEAFGRFKGKET